MVVEGRSRRQTSAVGSAVFAPSSSLVRSFTDGSGRESLHEEGRHGDGNARLAIRHGLAPEVAIQCLTVNPARHMRLTPWVGSLAPGRFADAVLLSDVDSLAIAEVWADGRQVSEGPRCIAPVPEIRWPAWATGTVNIGRRIAAEDFRLAAEPGRATMKAAVIRPFHWHPDFSTMELPLAVAPAMGSNVVFATVVVKGMGMPWQAALAMVALTGALFLLLSLSRLRERVAEDVPEALKVGIQAGVGTLIVFIGLRGAGFIVANPSTFVAMGSLASPPVLLTLFGLLLTPA